MSETNYKTKEELEAMGAEELLALGLDDLADVTGFMPVPAGLYSWEVKSIGIEKLGADEKEAIVMALTLTNCDELVKAEESDQLPEFPYTYKENFFLAGGKGFGVRLFKTMFGALAKEQGWSSVQDVVEGAVGFTGKSLIKVRSYKKEGEDEKRFNNQIDATTVVFD